MSGALAVRDNQDWWDEKQSAALVQLGLEDANNGDLAVFLHYAQRTGLDPFAKQIYMIGRNAKDGNGNWGKRYTIQASIDGLRVVARRAADKRGEAIGYADTLWCGPDGQWRDVWLSEEAPAAAKVTVIRNGQPFSAVAKYSEYVQTYKPRNSDTEVPTAMWVKMAATMVAKCAEALALRKAFPHDLSGIYSDDEMAQADNGALAAPAGPELIPAGVVRAKMVEAAGGNRDLAGAVWIEAQVPDGDVPRVLADQLVTQCAERSAAEAAEQQGQAPADDVVDAEVVEDEAPAQEAENGPTTPTEDVTPPPAPEQAQQPSGSPQDQLQAFLQVVEQAAGNMTILRGLRGKVGKLPQAARRPASDAVTKAMAACAPVDATAS